MKPLLLCILDGVGIKSKKNGNALNVAKMPNYDYFFKNFPNSKLSASGEAVGLPKGQMGNSEVGHVNIGTGRKISHPLNVISKALKDGSFEDNSEFKKLIKHCQKYNSNLHICGLLSDGGVHSSISHLMGIIDVLKKYDIKVYYHVFTDGRDTLPHTSLNFISELEDKIKETKVGKIATISGRYYAMDRDNRWDRIKKTYDEMTKVTKKRKIKNKINDFYKRGITDEFIVPFSVCDGIVRENDGILVYNFRPDRLRELFTAFTNPDFDGFEREFIKGLKVVTMMPVDKNVKGTSMFKHDKVDNYLGEIFEREGFRQLRIAETEKYAHVTYFFDGENKKKLKNCDQLLIPSKKVSTYDLAPEMSAYEITENLLKIMKNYDIIILNFAGGDMVGHTGNFDATVKALEVIDECLGRIYEKIKELNGCMIITADHGNCDDMIDSEGNIKTAHSLSRVPFIITKDGLTLKNGKLSDVAPTILELLNIDIPKEMTGKSLIG